MCMVIGLGAVLFFFSLSLPGRLACCEVLYKCGEEGFNVQATLHFVFVHIPVD